MTLPNHSGSVGSYRYGFQGQEKDDEVKGEGNSLNYKYRMHDPRVGRFFAVDPLAPNYPSISHYSFSENNVIMSVELEGLEKRVVIDNTLGNPKSTDVHDIDMGTSKAYHVINSDFGTVINLIKGMDLIDSKSTIKFTNTGVRTEIITTKVPWYFGGTSKDEHIFVKYDVSFEMHGANFSVPVEMTTGLSTHFEGSNPIDYVLVLAGGKFLHKSLFQKAIQKSVYAQAAEQMFKNFYGTTRGKLLERLAATTKYSTWKWLDDIASNFPTFDFVKGSMYSSFKTFKGETFQLSKFKGYVDAIKGKINNGFKFKGVTYKPKDGTLDILVPKEQLKEFVKEGGKFYDDFQKLVKHGEANGVKVKVGSTID